MSEIVVNFQPFSLYQSITVYSDGDILDEKTSTIDNIVDSVNGLRKKYNIDNIDLIGNVDYVSGFKNRLMETNFTSSPVSIEIISR